MGSSIAGIIGTDAQQSANKQAQQTVTRANILAQQNLSDAKMQARNDLSPYANVGLSALQQLAYGMGLDVPTQQYTAADAPKTLSGNSGDPLWDQLVNEAQAPHIAKYGVPVSSLNRDQDANNFYNAIAQKYADAKNAQLQAQGGFVGQGNKGDYLNYGQDQYSKDVGYTPMVTSLADLQATPGYQFQLEQGLQGVNRSAAARGGLLSGANLKAINDYAQGQAATGYQAAWDRAQQAYQNAFARNQQKVVNLSSLAGAGQTAATNQGGYSMNTGVNQANVGTNAANNIAQLQQDYGKLQAQQYSNFGGVANQGLTAAFGGQNITNAFNKGMLNL